jgi:hypothetical protein
MQTVTFRFKFPIQHKNEWIDQIEVHAPTLRDLKALDGVTDTFTRAAKMIELLTGLTQCRHPYEASTGVGLWEYQ